MAADPKKAKGKEPDDEAEGADQAADEGKKKKKKLFIMIGVAVLLMAISVGGTLLAVKLMSSDSKKDVAEESDEADEESEDEDSEEDEENEEVVAEVAPAIYFTMTPNFTVNFNVDGRQRYLQAEITLLYRNPEVESLLTLHMPAIRNQLVMLLGGKSFEELQNHDSREKLKLEALAAIQSILDKENAALNKKDVEAEKDEEEEESDEEDAEEDSEKLPPVVIEQVLFTRFVMQ
jgi:flagellar protein FliL